MRAAAPAAGLLLAAYLLTLAPGVTFWDAGEFVSAAHVLGVPHPPGTPLWVIAAASLARLLPFETAVETNLLSALCAAAAGGVLARLVAGWTGSTAAGIAAALAAGAMTAVWSSATETEVYAASLLLAALSLLAADRMGRAAGPPGGRHLLALAYLFGLAASLHVSALVAAPAVALLAAARPDDDGAGGRVDPRTLALVAGLAAAAAGVGTASLAVALAGAAVAALSAPRRALAPLLLVLLGATPILFLLVRARHDPWLNQGNPSTWDALLDVVARRQYAVPPAWPRRAPLWIQLGNVFEWADWQVALGLARRVEPSPWRTPFTLLWGLLAVAGAGEHRRRDARSWRAVLALLLAGTLGVALYLNLRAGPSFGWGVLPADAPREPRERDYFFALGFLAWGLWAGVGAATVARRLLAARGPRLAAGAGLALAALPVALNWRAMDRRAEPDASLAARVGDELLGSAPPDAVVFLGADNDTYPLWHARAARGLRSDVTPVTVPLLGAAWYRAEHARRDGLLAGDLVARWHGAPATVAAIAAAARRAGRPVAASPLLDASEREAAAPGPWRRRGLLLVPDDGDPAARAADRALTERVAAGHRARLLRPASPAIDPVVAYMLGVLCAVDSASTGGRAPAEARLAPACKVK